MTTALERKKNDLEKILESKRVLVDTERKLRLEITKEIVKEHGGRIEISKFDHSVNVFSDYLRHGEETDSLGYNVFDAFEENGDTFITVDIYDEVKVNVDDLSEPDLGIICDTLIVYHEQYPGQG